MAGGSDLPPQMMAKRPIVKELSLLESQSFERQVTSANAKILRYKNHITNMATNLGAEPSAPELKARVAERVAEDKQEEEKLIREMMKLEARKAELSRKLGTGCGKGGLWLSWHGQRGEIQRAGNGEIGGQGAVEGSSGWF